MRDIFIKLRQRAAQLTAAFEAHETAYQACRQAEDAWCDTRNEHTGRALLMAQAARDDSRTTVIHTAELLLDTTAIYLVGIAGEEFPTLRLRLNALRESFRREAQAFKEHSYASVWNSPITFEAWTSARAEIISRAWPFLELVNTTFTDPERSIETNLDGSPAAR